MKGEQVKAKIGSRLLASLPVAQNKPYEVWDTDLRGFLLKVRPGSPASYYFSYYKPTDGKRTRYLIGRVTELTATQARDKALELMADVVKGVDPMAEKRKRTTGTFSAFLEKRYAPWLGDRPTAQATLARLRRCFPELMDKPLEEISAWAVERKRSERLKSGVKAATVNREVTDLKAALSRAIEWGLLERHPLSAVKPKHVDDRGVVRYLSEAEEVAIRRALDGREEQIRRQRDRANEWRTTRGYQTLPDLRAVPFADHLKPMVLISLNTGVRRGELFKSSWERVDLAQRMLTVAGATAKSGYTRHIPLNAEAFAILEAWWIQKGRPSAGLVFESEDGRVFDNVKSSWQALLERAGVRNFRWHDMRHHFASRLVMAGVDLNTVRELLGHSDMKMTLRYAHLAPFIKAEAVSRLVRPSIETRHKNAAI